MTCEVAVLNKHAVVIAADSAVTYSNGSPEKRYSKGGNKIFQLSNHHAVSVMIYDSGSMLGVHWELVIKAFREYLGAEAFETVEGYAREFLEYVRTNLVFSRTKSVTRHFCRQSGRDLCSFCWRRPRRILI
ncbi:MAG: hypothetical protein CBARDMAM_0287 [uncultured Caballeronia sp.]|nr:MAG: hypothetical protein CBARDMAM_0287 [uncultured Caballeronia sp.]